MQMVDKRAFFNTAKHIVYPLVSSNRIIFTFVGILLFALLIDSSLVKIYTFLNSILQTNQQYFIFILITFAFVAGQYYILGVVRSRIEEIESTWALLGTLHKIVSISQYILSLLLLIIIFEIFLNSYYNTLLLLMITIFSYGLSCIALGLLAIRFFLWFKSKGSYSIFFYGLSSSIFVLSNLFLMIFIIYVIPQIGEVIQSHGHLILYFDDPGSFEYVLYNGYVISSILSFIMTWIATAMILYYYSNRIGKSKYWIIISLPLVYFLSQFISLFLNLYGPIMDQNIFLYMVSFSVIFSISKAAGGVLFGIAFWVMVRKMNKITVLKNFLIMVAIGFMLLFVSEQAVSLISFPYPPFGLTSVATLGLSSYLILVGLYYSAISVSKDIRMRKSILSSVLKDVNFLMKIGSAEVEKETEKMVGKLIDQHLEKIHPPIENTTENIKEYVDEIMTEIRRMKGI
jgi:hypothetical protein